MAGASTGAFRQQSFRPSHDRFGQAQSLAIIHFRCLLGMGRIPGLNSVVGKVVHVFQFGRPGNIVFLHQFNETADLVSEG